MSSSTDLDDNFFSVYGQTGVCLDGRTFSPANPAKYASILKVSHSVGVSGAALVVANGKENAVDINVCKDVTLCGDFGSSGSYGDQVITIKGGSEDIVISGVIHSNGGRARVQIGQWSDQSYNLSRRITLDLVSDDGSKVDVVIGRATEVTLRGGCVEIKWKGRLLTAYWWIKWTVRKVLRIPVGTKGPSWL